MIVCVDAPEMPIDNDEVYSRRRFRWFLYFKRIRSDENAAVCFCTYTVNKPNGEKMMLIVNEIVRIVFPGKI